MKLVVTWNPPADKPLRNYGELTADTLRVFAEDRVRQGEPEVIEVFLSDPTIPPMRSERE